MPDPATERLLDDLRVEGEDLERLVVGAGPSAWDLRTPAPGWTVGHQIGHLAATDEALVLSLSAPGEFRNRLRVPEDAELGSVDREATAGHAEGPDRTLDRWRRSRAAVLEAAAHRDPKHRLPWFGPDMSLRTALSARYMETWAHAQDIATALGTEWPARQGLRHVITLAILARDFAFQNRGLTPPDGHVRVDLAAPDGSRWVWGPEDADQVVEGEAEDFALLAVRRLHREDARVTARGADADRWLDVVQAYAGPPGPGRQPETTSDAGR